MSELKDSIIGLIPEDAEIKYLDECILKIIDYRGKTPKKLGGDWVNEGIPAISAKNIHNGEFDNVDSIRYVTKEIYEKWMKEDVQSGDCLLVSEGATLGEYLYWDEDHPIVLSQRLFCIRTNPEVLYSKYFYAYMTTSNFQIQVKSKATGSSVDGLRQTAVRQLLVPILAMDDQIFIGDLLYNFDKKIKELKAQNKTLEQTAQTIFKEWFGKYQVGDELPDGWRVGKIGEYITDSIGGDYGKEKPQGDYKIETICLRGTDLPDMKMGVPEKAPVRFLKKSKIEKCKLLNGDIVIEISGGTENQSTGRVAYINQQILNQSKSSMTCVNFCRILRPKNPENSYFIYSLFEYLYNRRILFNWENGTTGIKNLNLKALLEVFELVLPDNDDLIQKFNSISKSSFEKIQTNNIQIQTLKQTRDTLLPKLMSGQIRVNEFKD